jgi:ADP-ribosylglycohydrolase
MVGLAPTEPVMERAASPIDAAKGCLLAGAVGDALGASVEFMSWDGIKRTFGSKGISDFAPVYGGVGLVTDDTQMALFTAEGLIRAYHRWASRGICYVPGVIWQSYQRWLLTQGIKSGSCDAGVLSQGPLIRERALFARRAPGKTCLAALQAPIPESGRAPNQSKGCGGVMRVAPCALLYVNEKDAQNDVFRAAVDCARLTHGHPTGYLSAGAFAVLVYEAAQGRPLDGAVDQALAILKSHEHSHEAIRAIERGTKLAGSREKPGPETLAKLGGGWIAEEALAIALYCALVSRSLQDALILAVNHDGDSDSTGSMTGNLMGAICGETAIPRRWLAQLELRDVIAKTGEDLAVCMTAEMDPDADAPVSARNQALWEKWMKAPSAR